MNLNFKLSLRLICLVMLFCFCLACKTQEQERSETSPSETKPKSSAINLLDYAPADSLISISFDMARLSDDLRKHIQNQQKQRLKLKSQVMNSLITSGAPDLAKTIVGFGYIWSALISSGLEYPRNQLLHASLQKAGPGWTSRVRLLLTPADGQSVEAFRGTLIQILTSNGFQANPSGAGESKAEAFKSSDGFEVFLDSDKQILQLTSYIPTEAIAPAQQKLLDSAGYKKALSNLKPAPKEQVAFYVNLTETLKTLEVEKSLKEAAAKNPSTTANLENILTLANSLESLIAAVSDDIGDSIFTSRMLVGLAPAGLAKVADLQELIAIKPDLRVDTDTIGLITINAKAFKTKIFSEAKEQAGTAFMLFPQLNNIQSLSIKVSEAAAGAPAPAILPMMIPNILTSVVFSDTTSAAALLGSMKGMLPGLQCQVTQDQQSKAIELCPTPFGFKMASSIDGNTLLMGTEPAVQANSINATPATNGMAPSANLAVLYINQEKFLGKMKEMMAKNPKAKPELLEQFNQMQFKSTWLSLGATPEGFVVNSVAEVLPIQAQ